MNLEAIANELEAEGFGTVGVNIFYEEMPSAVDRGLLVTAMTPITRNPYAPDWRQGAFQVISRQLDDDDYQDPAAILENVINAISGEGKVIGDMTFRQLRARHDPFVFPKSNGNIVEASVNFDIVFSC